MDNQSELDQVKKMVKRFFEKTTLEVEINSIKKEDNTLSISLKSEEPQVLIGEKGESLITVQRLLKLIIKKQLNIQDPFYVDLDINDYKKKKCLYLKELAKNAAEEVALTKKEKVLPPMPAYERRFVHMELANKPNITTESIGEEPERRIRIKPFP